MSDEIDRVRQELRVVKARQIRTYEVERRQERLERKLDRLERQRRAAAWGDSEEDLQ